MSGRIYQVHVTPRDPRPNDLGRSFVIETLARDKAHAERLVRYYLSLSLVILRCRAKSKNVFEKSSPDNASVR